MRYDTRETARRWFATSGPARYGSPAEQHRALAAVDLGAARIATDEEVAAALGVDLTGWPEEALGLARAAVDAAVHELATAAEVAGRETYDAVLVIGRPPGLGTALEVARQARQEAEAVGVREWLEARWLSWRGPFDRTGNY